MATDKNRFDEYLKETLWRDIAFRVVVWVGIATATAYFANHSTQALRLEYFSRAVTSLTPVLNIVGVIGIIAAMLAMMFKDAEHVNPAGWGQTTKRGKFGGFVRRAAGDLTLWVIGALIALFAASLVAVLPALWSGTLQAADGKVICILYLYLAMFLAVICTMNVHVRRLEPPLAQRPVFSDLLTSSGRVVFLYLLGFAFIGVWLWFQRCVLSG